MKRIIYIIAVVFLGFMTYSCSQEIPMEGNETPAENSLTGMWAGTDVTGNGSYLIKFEKGKYSLYSTEKDHYIADGILWNCEEDTDFTLVEESLYYIKGNALFTLPENEFKWLMDYMNHEQSRVLYLHNEAMDGSGEYRLEKITATDPGHYTTLTCPNAPYPIIAGESQQIEVIIGWNKLLYSNWDDVMASGKCEIECDNGIQWNGEWYELSNDRTGRISTTFNVDAETMTEGTTYYARITIPGAETLEIPFVTEKWNSILMKEQETLDYNAKTLTQQIKVSSGSSADHNFNATSNADWLTIKISGNTLSYSVSENNTGATREAVITITSDVSKTHNAYLTVTQTGELPEISLNENLLFVEAPNRYDNSGKPYYYSEMGDLIHLDIKYPRPGAIAYISESDVIQDGFMVSSHALKGEIDTIYDNYIYFYVYTPGKSYDFTIDYWKDGQILTSKKFTVKANPW